MSQEAYLIIRVHKTGQTRQNDKTTSLPPILILFLIPLSVHVPAFLFVGDFGIDLCRADIRMPQHLGKRFYGNSVGQTNLRCHGMATGVPRYVLLYSAKSDDCLEVLAGGNVLRNGQEIIFLCHAVILFDNPHGNVHHHDVGFHACLLSLGHNPQLAVERGLHIVLSQVLHIGKRQAGKAAEYILTTKFQIHHLTYLILGQIVPVATLGGYTVIHERVTDYPAMVLGNGNHTAQGHHVNPYRIVTALLFGSQEDVKVGNESRSEFFQSNIADTVAGLDELLQMLIDRTILVQEGVLHFLGRDIVVPFGYLLVFGIDADTYLVQETVGFQGHGTFPEARLLLTSHKSG